MFTKVWPTTQTFKYFPYFKQLSYAEKLMGKKFSINLINGDGAIIW